jgi:endonuclease-3
MVGRAREAPGASQGAAVGTWARRRRLGARMIPSVKRSERAARIETTLSELYPTVPIPLDHTDAFTLLVAVVLSAQTTDKKVNEVTPALFAEAPTPAAMAALGSARILQHIRQVGLAPQKARALEGLGRLIETRHGGAVPRSFEELEALPGVGHKTASVVMAQAFGVPAFPVDTHIHRLAWRWGLSDGSKVEKTEADLKAVFPEPSWNPLHLRIIFFGREHCPALRHDHDRCPICAWAASKAVRQTERAAAEASLLARTAKARTKRVAKPDGTGPKEARRAHETARTRQAAATTRGAAEAAPFGARRAETAPRRPR